MENTIKLDKLNQAEALRYLGYGDNAPDKNVQSILDECEQEVLKTAQAKFVYKVFAIHEEADYVSLEGTDFILKGKAITKHLQGCEKAVLMGVTISSGIDRLIRMNQIRDMAKAVMIDSLSSVAVEQACDRVEELIKKQFCDYHQTWRFGIGYGDFPLNSQNDFLKVINASKQIGLCTNQTSMLTPTKSVTAVIGLSTEEIKQSLRGCTTCNMNGKCAFRKKGGRCNV